MTQSRATAIGHFARQILHTHQNAEVVGTTKQGLFLQANEALTLYLSTESFRSPITINIRDVGEKFYFIQPKDQAELYTDRIIFPNNDVRILIRNPIPWKTPIPPKFRKLRKRQLISLYKQAKKIVDDHPYLSLLEMIIADFPPPVEDLGGVEHRIETLSKATATGDISEIYKGIRKILGAGPGLTPLGDDILIGFLMAVKRTNRHVLWFGNQDYIGNKLVAVAAMNTTTLSWSLLKCAAAGSGDERWIRVLDYLIAGKKVPNQDLSILLEWGSSSGIGVLAGMLLVLSN